MWPNQRTVMSLILRPFSTQFLFLYGMIIRCVETPIFELHFLIYHLGFLSCVLLHSKLHFWHSISNSSMLLPDGNKFNNVEVQIVKANSDSWKNYWRIYIYHQNPNHAPLCMRYFFENKYKHKRTLTRKSLF